MHVGVCAALLRAVSATWRAAQRYRGRDIPESPSGAAAWIVGFTLAALVIAWLGR